MKTTSRLASTGLLALSACLLTAPAAQALFMAPAAVKTDMDKLKEAGYTCERFAVGAHWCKKSGSPTMVCDNAGSCTAYRTSSTQTSPTSTHNTSSTSAVLAP